MLGDGSTVLDVGCGIGGTTRFLAKEHGCTVTGLTISGRQVQIAQRLTDEEACKASSLTANAVGIDHAVDGMRNLGSRGGKVMYREADAEMMAEYYPPESFDAVWVSEALSHFPDKPLFFRNAARVLRRGEGGAASGKLILADWFKAEDLTPKQFHQDIEPIEGMNA